MTFRALAVLLAAICLYLFIGVSESPRVAFVRPPSYVTDQEIVVLQVRVEPDSENRRLIVAAVEGDFVVASSSEDLPGPRTRWVRLRLPAGELMLLAILLDTHGEVARDTHRFLSGRSRRGRLAAGNRSHPGCEVWCPTPGRVRP